MSMPRWMLLGVWVLSTAANGWILRTTYTYGIGGRLRSVTWVMLGIGVVGIALILWTSPRYHGP